MIVAGPVLRATSRDTSPPVCGPSLGFPPEKEVLIAGHRRVGADNVALPAVAPAMAGIGKDSGVARLDLVEEGHLATEIVSQVALSKSNLFGIQSILETQMPVSIGRSAR